MKDLTQLLINESTRLEPCLAEVCMDEIQETKIVYERTDFSVATSSQATVFGLRTIVGNRQGFITTNSMDPEQLKRKAREAQMVARLSPPSPFHKIAERQASAGVFGLEDEKLTRINAKEILNWAQLLVDEATADKRVTLDRAEVNLTSNSRIVQNSHGVFQKMKQTVCSWSLMGMARDGTEVTSFDYEGDSTHAYSKIEGGIRDTVRDFNQSVIGSLGAKSCKSYKGLVLLHPAAVSSLVAGVVTFNVNGRGQQDGMSQWRGKEDEMIAAEALTVSESPHDETRPAEWTPFDREGVPTQNRDIIRNGKLTFTAHNCFSAARANTKPTGNASGSARGVPGIGLHGLDISKGKTSMDDLYKALNTGLVLKRFSGNADPVSGEFSGVAKNSWWVERGRRAAPVKEVMVAGNMFDLLKQIRLVGKDSFTQMGSFRSPYLLVDGVSVTSQ